MTMLEPLLHRRGDAARRGGARGVAGGADGARGRRRSPRSCSSASPAASRSSAAAGNNGGDGRVCARVLREARPRGRRSSTAFGELGEPDVIVDALLGIGLQRGAARGRGADDRADQRARAAGRRGRRPLGRQRLDGRGRRARPCARRRRSPSARPRSGSPSRPGASTPARSQVAPIGLEPREHEHALVPASVLARRAAQERASTKYRAGLGARRRRLARAHRRADARGARRVPRRRGLRRRRRARVDAAGARGAAARGRQAAAARGHAGRLLPRAADARPRGGRAGGRRRDRAGARPQRRHASSSSAILLERLDVPVVLDADALWELEPFARAAPTVLTPHAGELARLLGVDAPRDRRAPARRRPPRRVAVRLGRAAQGRGHARRRAARGGARRGYGTPALATAGSGDVLTGDRRRVPRERRRAAARRGRGRRRARRRLASSSTAGRASSPRTCCPACSARWPGTGCSARRSSEIGTQRDHDRPRRAAPQRAALLRACSAAPSSGRWSRRTRYGHGATDCATAALDAGATALCVATVAEALELRGALAGRAHPRARARASARGRAARATRGSSWRSPTARSRRASAVHLKLDTGMGRWGLSELPAPTREVVGVMTHLATADSDLDFARAAARALPRGDRAARRTSTRHAANSAAALRLPESRFDAARCGIALYGLSPFGDGRRRRRPRAGALVAQRDRASRSCCGPASRRATAAGSSPSATPGSASSRSDTRTGSAATSPAPRCSSRASAGSVVGTVSMDAFAVELDRELPAGTPVTIVGDGRAARGARARRRHDHLRARLRDRLGRAERGRRGWWSAHEPTLDRRAALQAERADGAARARLDDLLPSLDGDERALDVGVGPRRAGVRARAARARGRRRRA